MSVNSMLLKTKHALATRLSSPKFWLGLARDIFIMAVILIGVSMYLQRDMASGAAPHIQASLISGEQIHLFKQKSDKPTLVYFWGTWCPICSVTSPAVNGITKDGHQVVTIAVASGSNSQISQYLDEHQYQFATVNEQQTKQPLSEQWGAHALPSIYLVNSNNQIVMTTSGATSYWGLKLRLWLVELLA
ncbi:protein disulfide oxidoreductase [Shewanella sp. WXL01]|nr:protein disulfide oxidoreductase [Shewanella sp. WXL01]